jgi:hypothetical protein
MELMMSHLHAGPTVAARGVDAAGVTFLFRGSVAADTPREPQHRALHAGSGSRRSLRVAPRP